MLHLAYEDGQHYNSVRRADDYSRGCPADIPDTLTPIADVGQVRWGGRVCVSVWVGGVGARMSLLVAPPAYVTLLSHTLMHKGLL